MIIKGKDLLLFNPDALKVEYLPGLKHSHYIIAYKNNKKFIIQGYNNEEQAREQLNILNEAVKRGETALEI